MTTMVDLNGETACGNTSDILISPSNENELDNSLEISVDMLSNVEQAKVIAEMYWKKAYNIVKVNASIVSNDVVNMARRHRAPNYLMQIILQPLLLTTSISLHDCSRISCNTSAQTLCNSFDDISLPNGGEVFQLVNECNGSLSASADIMCLPFGNNIHGLLSAPDEGELIFCRRVIPSSPSEQCIVKPDPLLQIQRRLHSVTSLATSDRMEVLCIQDVYKAVKNGYKQLAETMLNVHQLAGPNTESILNVDQLTGPKSAFHLLKPRNGMQQTPIDENSISNECNNPIQNHLVQGKEISPRTTEDTCNIEKINLGKSDDVHEFCSVYDDLGYDEVSATAFQGADPHYFKKTTVYSSSSETLFTYRSDDTSESDVIDLKFQRSDLSMPFFFILPPISVNDQEDDEDVQYLLPSNKLPRRYHPYRRPRRTFSFGKNVMARQCLR